MPRPLARARNDGAEEGADTSVVLCERRADALVLLAHTGLTGAQQGVSNADAYQVMLHVDADTAIPHWHGEPMGLSVTVSFLWAAADAPATESSP